MNEASLGRTPQRCVKVQRRPVDGDGHRVVPIEIAKTNDGRTDDDGRQGEHGIGRAGAQGRG